MTLAVPQLELDFALGHNLPWVKVLEIARALDCSEFHVSNLFDDAKIDFVIDIKSGTAARPCYRILREAWENFRTRSTYQFHPGPVPHPCYETVLAGHLSRLPAAMSSRNVGSFLRASEDLVLSLGDHFSDVGAGSQTYFRASKNQLLTFINQRRLA